MSPIPYLSLSELGQLLQYNTPAPPPSTNSLSQWKMERDDAPIFTYLYSQHQPRRHLEFGTWQGFGTCLCLEATPATVWTINLLEGETKADGSWAYGERISDGAQTPADRQEQVFCSKETGPLVYNRTDARGYIGRFYRDKNLGHRVCQIYCDSRVWDTSCYPPGFFDSVLIDGGHQAEVVINDTRKALPLLRSGGMILWHDFCPLPEALASSHVTQDVVAAVTTLRPELASQLSALAWINPSQILVGIKK